MQNLWGPFSRKTLHSNDQNQVADQRFSLKQWFAGSAQSRGLKKPGCGHCYYFSMVLYTNIAVSSRGMETKNTSAGSMELRFSKYSNEGHCKCFFSVAN